MKTEKEKNLELIGKKIKERRIKLGITQSSLSEVIDVSPNYIGQIERGERIPSLETIIKIANSLSVSLDTLFADSLEIGISEQKNTYLTEKQIKLMQQIIKMIKDNF